MCLNYPGNHPLHQLSRRQRVGGCYSRETPIGVEDGRLLSLQSHIFLSFPDFIFQVSFNSLLQQTQCPGELPDFSSQSINRWQEPNGNEGGWIIG